MKILFVHNYYPLLASGEDSVMDEERRLLEEAGHHVLLFSMRTQEGGLVNLFYCGLCAVWNPMAYRKVRHLLRTEKPDVVHCHNTFPLISPSVYWACKREKVPVVQTLHNYRLVCSNGLFLRDQSICEKCLGKTFPWPALKFRCYRGRLLSSLVPVMMLWVHRMMGTWKNKVDRYIALTDFSKQKFVDSGVIPLDRIVVKPNFINPVRTPCDGGTDGAKKYALFVGRLCQEKGVEVLIKAWLKAASENEEVRECELLVVGGGPDQERLAAMVCVPPGSPQVKINFLGFQPREKVMELMRGARFLVLPSLWYEGFPMTIVESFSCGTPIIASAIGNMKSIIKDMETGLLFVPGSVEGLSDKIVWALQNRSMMDQMGEVAHRVFEDQYSVDANKAQLIDIYESVRTA